MAANIVNNGANIPNNGTDIVNICAHDDIYLIPGRQIGRHELFIAPMLGVTAVHLSDQEAISACRSLNR